MEKNDTFLLAVTYLKEGNYKESLIYLRRLMADYEAHPSVEVPAELLSYMGLAVGLGEDRIQEAVNYCTAAIKKEFFRPEHYLNLAKVYLKAGRRSRAVDALFKGLKIDGQHPGILEELRKLGFRRQPILPFLPRGSAINKYLGMLLASIKGSGKKKVSGLGMTGRWVGPHDKSVSIERLTS